MSDRMTPERWRQVTEVFHAARARDASARASYLEQACAGDRALRAEVDAMLAAPHEPPEFGERSMSGSIGDVQRLEPGVMLGPYRIDRPIGAGGMGEVYRARDTTLGRDVAIKVLPMAFAADPERLARFEREARMLAALNHPHIGAIYGFEESDGVRALVLELVEGPTLANRLAKGSIPLTESLGIARQIADALDAAHENGIIHRDLKPANIKITPSGAVKVLDFGLAKAAVGDGATPDLTQSPTITVGGTREGIILGTAAYMSPEQARGAAVDKRSDLWALGVVLYEMLAGRRLFDGATVSDTLALVLTTEPDWSTLPPATPAPIRKLLRRCLEKDRKRRLDSAAAARLDIEDALDATPVARAADAVPRRVMWARMAFIAGATALAAGFLGWMLWPTSRAQAVDRFAIDVPTGQTFRATGRPILTVSPDGRALVYNTADGLYLRAMDAVQPRLVPGTDAALTSPFFSPDGQWIGFWDPSGQLKRVMVTGGTPVVVASGLVNPFGVSWGPDGTILVGQPRGILRVLATGGTPELVVKASAGEQVDGPQLLPDGDAVLFSVTTAAGATRWDKAAIAVQSLRTGRRTIVLRGGSGARYVPPGYLVYAVGSTLFAVTFDAEQLRVIGGAVPVVEGVMRAALPNLTTAAANYGVTVGGTLIYAEGTATAPLRTLAWVDRQGRETPVGAPTRSYEYPRISPDGGRVAVDTDDQERDVWAWDEARRTLNRLTFAPGFDVCPVWMPGGRRVIFSSDRDGKQNLYAIAADGTGAAERLTNSPNKQAATAVTADGTQLIFTEAAPQTGEDVMQVTVTGTHTVEPLVQTPASERNGIVSPDGRWLAYEANDSGAFEIYVRPYPDVARAIWQVSTGGGAQPLWSRDGRELFYVSPSRAVRRVGVAHEASWTATMPMPLLKDGSVVISQGTTSRSYDVSPDGQRFLVMREASGVDSPPHLIVVQHWDEELKRLVPAK